MALRVSKVTTGPKAFRVTTALRVSKVPLMEPKAFRVTTEQMGHKVSRALREIKGTRAIKGTRGIKASRAIKAYKVPRGGKVFRVPTMLPHYSTFIPLHLEIRQLVTSQT